MGEGNTEDSDHGELSDDAAESENLSMCGNFRRENRESLLASACRWHVTADRTGNTDR